MERGDKTIHSDYLNNIICIGDIVVYVPFFKERTTTLVTGEIIGMSPLKLKVKPLGKNSWEWVYGTALINIKNLAE